MWPTVESSVLGPLTRHEEFEDWWEGGPVAVPLFGGQPLPVTFMDFVPSEDPTFVAEADTALAAFLAKGEGEGHAEATPPVYADYLHMLDVSDIEPLDVPTPEAIWDHVFPHALVLERHPENRSVYLRVACGCGWEVEHGLQLVYRRGERLTRVSEEAGSLTGPSISSLPDDEDPLPSPL